MAAMLADSPLAAGELESVVARSMALVVVAVAAAVVAVAAGASRQHRSTAPPLVVVAAAASAVVVGLAVAVVAWPVAPAVLVEMTYPVALFNPPFCSFATQSRFVFQKCSSSSIPITLV